MQFFCGGKTALAGYVAVPIADYSLRTNKIKVCFETPTAPLSTGSKSGNWQYGDFLSAISQWTTSELSRAGIEVSGWKDCGAEDTSAIHLRIHPEIDGAWTQNLGKANLGIFSAVNMGFMESYKKVEIFGWSPRSTLLHEVLHALGFQHEHERPDFENCETFHSAVTIPSLSLGDYDRNSIMNYCRPRSPLTPKNLAEDTARDLRQGHLSDEDVAVIRALMFQPIAEFQNILPAMNGLNEADISVSGLGVEKIRYQFGLAKSLHCNEAQSYGPWEKAGNPLRLVIPPVAGEFKLCVLGGNQDASQDARAYSSMSWQKKPGILSISVPSGNHDLREKLPIKILGEQFAPFFLAQYRQADEKASCSTAKGYRKIDSEELDLKSVIQWPSGFGPNGNFHLCAVRSLDEEGLAHVYEENIAVDREDALEGAGSVIGIPKVIHENDEVNVSVRSILGFYPHYRYSLVAPKEDCAKAAYSPALPTAEPIRFRFHAGGTGKLCLLVQNQPGFWGPLNEAAEYPLEGNAKQEK